MQVQCPQLYIYIVVSNLSNRQTPAEQTPTTTITITTTTAGQTPTTTITITTAGQTPYRIIVN